MYRRFVTLALATFCAVAAAVSAQAQAISLTSNATYSQNFDTLSNTAGSTTNNLTITGWFLTEGGGGARDNEQYAVDTGSSTTGDMYSYGAAGSTERALGQLRSGTLVPLFGAAFTNNTGTTITALTIGYTGEEWRLGTAGRTDQMNFEYSTNATSVSTGTWTPVSALNFVTPDTATTGAKNGNAAADRTVLSTTISGLSIPNGATFWIRWNDADASGADDGLAVDDFTLTPTLQVSDAAPTITAPADPAATVPQGSAQFTVNVSGSDDKNVFNWSATAGTGIINVNVGGGQGTSTVTYNVTVASNFSGIASFTATLSDNVNTPVNANVNISVIAPPAQPAGVAATSGTGHVALTWNAVGGASSYHVKRSTTAGTGYTTIASPATNSYDDTTTTDGTQYFYVVSAVGFGGESIDSAEVTATPMAAPAGLAATAGTAHVALSWNAVAGATGYDVRRSTTAGSGYASIATPSTNSYDDTTAANGTTYYYVVVATNANGVSAASGEVSAKPNVPGKIVISQVYGGGGNSGAVYKNDFIELFNAGGTAVTVNGWSVQYTSATGTTWQSTNLSGSIAPGQYYLVQEAVGAGGTTNLPTPDATGAIAMSATAGKVALVNATTALTGACPTGASIIDFVGFGSTANCFEGAGPTPAPSNTNAVFRASSGCTDANNNSTDFAAAAAAPRNTATALHDCTGGVVVTNNPPVITAPANPIATVQQGAAPFNVNISGTDDNNIFNWTATPGAGVTSVTVNAGQGTATVSYSVTLNGAFSGTASFTATLSDNVNPAVSQLVNINVTATPTAPATPTGLSANAGNAHVLLSWNAVSGATSYNVKRSTTNGSGYATIASPSSASYDDGAAVNGTTYYYVVTAVGPGGESAPTAQVSATPLLPASQVGVVISQLYGGGGNAYANDYVELLNVNQSGTVDLSGYSLQYGSASGNFGSVATNIYTFPNGTTLAAGKYLTVKFGTPGTGAAVPFDLDGGANSLNMSGSSGKVAFVNSSTALGCGATPCSLPDARIIDVVAYGAANDGEGGTTAGNGAALSASTGAVRKQEGCQDTNNNNNDFTVESIATGLVPRTAATPAHICPPPNNPPVLNPPADPIAGVSENASPFTVNLTGTDDNNVFSWSVTAGTGVQNVAITSGAGTGSITVTVTLQPNFYGTASFTASLSDTVNVPVTATAHIAVARDLNINHVPTITAPADPVTTVARNTPGVNVNLSGNDDNSVYNWSATAGSGVTGVVIASGQGTANVTFNATIQAGFIGTASFTASLSDGVNAPANQVVNIGVSPTGSTVSHVVISQLYGGGGNSGAAWTNDYVELYNPTGSPVDMTGWTLQYASSTNTSTFGSIAPLGGIIGPGEYFLVSLASGGNVGSPLPAANIYGDINMSGTAGKVVLVRNSDAVSASTCSSTTGDPDVVDFIGYGSANCSETSPAPAPTSSTTALFRASNGDVDTNNNSSDFANGAANPRRTAAIQEIGPAVVTVDPARNDSIAPRDANIVVTFSEPVTVDDGWFGITCGGSGAHTSATVAASGTRSYTIIPNDNFAAGETCTVTIFHGFVHDTDSDDSAPNTDTLVSDVTWSFTISTGTPPPYPSTVHLTMGNPSNAVADINSPNNYLMQKGEMAISYNRDLGRPNWVSWHLTDEWIGSLTRVDTFRADPAVPPAWYRVLGSDFQGSGFDRGHMTPNADRDKETSIPINQATYLMTNMVAQAPDNNQGPWANLENYLRTLLVSDELYIVAGPAGVGGTGSNGSATTIAGGHVTVPSSTWKCALILPKASGDDVARVTASTQTLCVIMPNVQGIRNDDWHMYLKSVKDVEALTGYNLFSNVPSAIQNSIEGGVYGGSNPPGAGNQSVTANEDSPKAFTLDVANPSGNALTYTIVSGPSHGQLAGSNGSETYTPAPDFNGTDTFTYRVSDGSQMSNTATVTITVLEANDAPVALDDAKSATGGVALTFPSTDLTANDSTGPADESAQTLTVTAVTPTAATHGTVSLSNGSITYTADVAYSGSASFTYTVCDNGVTAGLSDSRCATGTVAVSVAAAVTHFSVTAPAHVTNGTAFNVTVTALDANNAAVAGYTGTVHFTSSSAGTLPADYTFTAGDNGAHTFSTTLTTNGAQSITAADGSINGTANLTVDPKPATHFSVTAPAQVTNGSAFNVTVTALDVDNATVTGYSGTVHFTSSSAGTLPADYTFTAGDNGAHTFSATLTANGAQSITAADGSITGTANLTVDPKPATHFSVTAPAHVTNGSAFSVTVTALDVDNATVTGYSGTVHVTSTSTGTLPADYTFTAGDNGAHTFSATLTTNGAQSVTAGDGSISGTANLTVDPKPATHFSVTIPANVTKGVPFNAVVTALDVDNATVTGYSGTIHVTSSSAGTLPPDYTFAAGDNGTHTFSVTLTTLGSQSVTVSDGTNSGSGNTTVNCPVPEFPPSAFNASNSGPVCAGQPVTLTATSPVSGSTFAWTGPNGFTSTQQNPVVTTGGTYNVVITVPGECGYDANASTIVVVNPIPSSAITAPASVCAMSTGTASVPDAGANATYTWAVLGGSIVGDATGHAITFGVGGSGPVHITVTVTSGAGCVSSASAVDVAVTPGPTATPNVMSFTSCGPATVTIPVTLTGTAPWSITWSDGVTQSNIMTATTSRTVSTVATISLHITSVSDASCTTALNPVPVTITLGVGPSITAQPQSAMVNAGSPATFSVTASGDGLHYQWFVRHGSQDQPVGTDSPTLTTAANSGASWWVRVTNGCGSVDSQTASATVIPVRRRGASGR